LFVVQNLFQTGATSPTFQRVRPNNHCWRIFFRISSFGEVRRRDRQIFVYCLFMFCLCFVYTLFILRASQ